MGILRGDRLQIPQIILLADTNLQRGNNIPVLFLEHIREDTVIRMPGIIVSFIVIHLINEEQAQDLDPLME